MSTTPPITADAGGFDFAAFESKANDAHARYLEVVATVDQNLQLGSFYNVPYDLASRNYHFVRVGLKGDHRAEEKALILRDTAGYVDAPPMVRCAGFESDGERTLIVCAKAEQYHKLVARKLAKASKRRDRLHAQAVANMEDRLRAILPGADMQVSARVNTGSVESFEDDLRAAVADLPKGRRR